MMSNRTELIEGQIKSRHWMIYSHSDDHCLKVDIYDCMIILSFKFLGGIKIRKKIRVDELTNLEVGKNKIRIRG